MSSALFFLLSPVTTFLAAHHHVTWLMRGEETKCRRGNCQTEDDVDTSIHGYCVHMNLFDATLLIV
jgi:hypothetical protein